MLDVSTIVDILRGMSQALLNEIREFLRDTGMSATYFGKAACGNSDLVRRLENGRSVTLVTVERIRAFIRARTGELDRPVAADTAHIPVSERTLVLLRLVSEAEHQTINDWLLRRVSERANHVGLSALLDVGAMQ